MYQCVPFLDVCMLFSDGRGFFLALSAAGHAGATPVHHGASFGPGWASVAACSGR